MANRAFQRLILDEDSQVIHFKCRFLPPAQQKPGSGWGHAPSGPTSTPSHPPAAHDAADGAHRQSKAASSEPKTGHRPSQLADAEPSDLATGPAAQVASSTDGQSGDTLSPNLDSEAGAAPSAGAAHAASMTGLGDIVVGDGRALLVSVLLRYSPVTCTLMILWTGRHMACRPKKGPLHCVALFGDVIGDGGRLLH